MSRLHALGIPYPRYLLVVVRRTAVMWLVTRLFVCMFVWIVFIPDFAVAIRQPVLGLPALFVWLDRRFYREVLLPANLGTEGVWLNGASLACALGLDVLAGMILGPA